MNESLFCACQITTEQSQPCWRLHLSHIFRVDFPFWVNWSSRIKLLELPLFQKVIQLISLANRQIWIVISWLCKIHSYSQLSFSNLKNKQHKNATLHVVSFSSETPCVSSIISCDWGFLKSILRSSEPKLQACLMINDRTCWELLQLTFSGLMSLLWSAESLLMNSSLCLISPPRFHSPCRCFLSLPN